MTRATKEYLAGGQIGKALSLTGIVWTVFLLASLATGLGRQRATLLEQALAEGEAIASMDLSFRNWVIGSGGIYLPAPADKPPAAFSRAADGAARLPSGRKLIPVSHAYAIRQLSADRQRQGLPHGHLVSAEPQDPADAADEWERAALAGFERGGGETASLDNGSRVRLLRAFRAEAACLACHTAWKKTGGVKGGISVEVPLARLTKAGAGLRLQWTLVHLLAWLAGLAGLRLAYKYLVRAQKTLLASEDKYRNLFETSRDALMTLEPPSWAFTSGNPATLAMFGAAEEADFTSRGPWELSPERQPDGRLSGEKAREMIETAMSRGTHFFEWTHKRISGEEFSADVLLTRLELEGRTFLQATVRDISERKQAQAQREALLAELKETLGQVKYLSGLIPICASCKKIRNDKGVWETVERYVAGHSGAKFSHGICPDCGKKLYGDLYEEEPPPEQ